MTTEAKPTHAYVAVAPCGCVRAAAVDLPDDPKETGKTVAGFIRRGARIERLPLEPVNAGRLLCFEEHPKATGCPHPQECPEWAKYREAVARPSVPEVPNDN